MSAHSLRGFVSHSPFSDEKVMFASLSCVAVYFIQRARLASCFLMKIWAKNEALAFLEALLFSEQTSSGGNYTCW